MCRDPSRFATFALRSRSRHSLHSFFRSPNVSNEQQRNPDKKLLSIKQLAALLGVAERTVSRLVDRRQAPTPVRLGRCVRWEREAIEQWIADGCPKRLDY